MRSLLNQKRRDWGTGIVLLFIVLVTILAYGNPPLFEFNGYGKAGRLSVERLKQIDQLMEKAIDQGVFSGGTVLVAQAGRTEYLRSFGYAYRYQDDRKRPAKQPQRASNQTIYDIASLSKIFTAMAVMKLHEEGKIELDAPVARYIPDFSSNGKSHVTVRQLLSHTSGLPASLVRPNQPVTKNANLIQAAFAKELETQPNTKVIYSDVGYIVLGELVKATSGVSLDRYVQKTILKPLGLHSTMYRPPAWLQKRIAATEMQTNTKRGLVWGQVHDETAWALGGVAGHAGLFSSAEDLAKVAALFLNKGVWKDKQILQPSSVRAMIGLQTGHISDAYRGLGWELNQSWYMGPFAKSTTFGHTGFTGTSLFVAPEEKVVVILLTNRVHPVRTGPNINQVRKELARIVYQSVIK
ncbi:serine hydrolase domain-containing protein [Laceyella putida]|uniref:Serine hydrolase domain-containing protein n=1 Tax=Laceyella putida TaxID=110101 RepID=A0ABW2RIA6_9BACL